MVAADHQSRLRIVFFVAAHWAPGLRSRPAFVMLLSDLVVLETVA